MINLEKIEQENCETPPPPKAEYFTQLSDALIVQLNILKYIGGVCKKVIPNLGIDQEVSLWGN